MPIFSNREAIDLAGPWKFVFDQADQNLRADWVGSSYPNDSAEQVVVPGIWNVAHPGVDGIGYFQRFFSPPPGWQGKRVELVCEGASYLTSAWVNGKYAGSHEGAYTPFRFDITDCLRWSEENQLVVRVASLSKARAVDGIWLHEAPAAKQSWYNPFGGIWGNISLEALPALSCHSVRATPDLQRRQVRVDVWLQNALPEARPASVKLVIHSTSKGKINEQASRVYVPPGTNRFVYHIPIPSPQLWTCCDPALYVLRIEVADSSSGAVDIQETRFGMREFTMRDGQYFLNGEPVYIRGVLLQPDYPISQVVPQDKATLERELRLVKDAGFNLVRIHLRPAAPGWLDLADEMGVLVYAETCLGWIRDSPRLLEHGLRETEALINRDYNHPSIVFWGIYNENPPAASLNGLELARYARGIDPSRVVVHNSGGSLAIDQDFGWIDRAWVLPAHETQPQKAMDIHLYLGCYLTKPVYQWLQSVGTNTLPSTVLFQEGFGSTAILHEFDREMHTYRGKVFVSEIGCGAFNDLDRTAAGFRGWENLLDAREAIGLRESLYRGFRQRGLENVFGSVARLFEQSLEMQSKGLARQVEAVLTNPQVSGYIVTQLNDSAWELEAGILDVWRNPKPAYDALKRLNQSHCLITTLQVYSTYPGSSTWMDITLLNQVPLEGSEQVEVTLQDQAGSPICRQTIQPGYAAGLHRLERFSFTAGEECSVIRILTRLLRGTMMLAEAVETIYCLPKPPWENLRGKVVRWGAIPPLFQGDDLLDIFRDPGTPGQESRVICAGLPAELNANEWADMLRLAGSGETVVVGALSPEDRIARDAFARAGVPIELHPGYGSWIGCHHWLPVTELTESLPISGGLVGEVFADILPRYILAELGGEVLAGSIRCSQSRDMPREILWQSDIEKLPFGKGRLVFCQYRLFEQSRPHPVASRLAYNLLRLAASM